jgi:hypothetical protein
MTDTPMMRGARLRQEARELRRFAERSPTPALKKLLLDIAQRYDGLAERIEKGQSDARSA